MQNKRLIIITAPSGAGKTTLVKFLLEEFENLTFSISATTRARRKHEVEGKDYYFINIETFKKHIAQNNFAEWEEVYGNQYYGTLKSEIRSKLDAGFIIIFDIDVQGAISLRKQYPNDSITIFIKPPSIEEIEKRLRNRKTETEDKIQRRLTKARQELKLAFSFDKVIYNDDLAIAKKDIVALIKTITALKKRKNKK